MEKIFQATVATLFLVAIPFAAFTAVTEMQAGNERLVVEKEFVHYHAN
jgi:hypothetical protein